MMRRRCVALFFILAAAARLPADAAGLPTPGFDWSGLYAGVNAGLMSDDSSFQTTIRNPDQTVDVLRSTVSGDQSGLIGGALIGYNLETGPLVIGAEADLSYLGYSDTRSRLADYDLYSATRKTSFDASWYGTLRARAGLATGGFLIYATAGLATGNMQATASVKAVDVESGDVAVWKASADPSSFGWTAGGGVEYGISNVSFGVEYRYVDLGSAQWSGHPAKDAADTFADATAKGSVDYGFSVVQASAKLHF